VWIDVNPKDLKNWKVYPHAFVVVVMGTHEDILIIPVRRLEDIINNHHIKLSGRGDYKLNIMVSSNYIEIREAPGENLQAYRNNFGQLG
jgi:hypothetical protein